MSEQHTQAAPAPTATSAVTTPDSGAHWYSALPAEIIGHAQMKGWDKMDASAAFGEAVKAHRAAESYLGVPQDQVLKLPKDMTVAADMKPIWERLGAPKDAAGYDFTGLSYGTQEQTNALMETARKAAVESNMPKGMAERLVRDIVTQMNQFSEQSAAAQTAIQSAAAAELEKNWGGRETPLYKANEFLAQQAVAKLGGEKMKGVIEALEGRVGYAAVMEFFRDLGQRMGEDRFISAETGGRGGIMTREQAVARKAELMGDASFTKRYMDGDRQAFEEMSAVLKMIAG